MMRNKKDALLLLILLSSLFILIELKITPLFEQGYEQITQWIAEDPRDQAASSISTQERRKAAVQERPKPVPPMPNCCTSLRRRNCNDLELRRNLYVRTMNHKPELRRD